MRAGVHPIIPSEPKRIARRQGINAKRFIAACRPTSRARSSATAATTITVTSTGDTSTTACVLRDAISLANAGDGSTVNGCTLNTTDTAFTIDFQSGVTGTITLGSPLPTITSNIAIDGPTSAPGITIDGDQTFHVNSLSQCDESEPVSELCQ
jgi:hypothetical protein